MVVARTRRQEALLAGVLKTIVGFALLSDLDGFKWPSKNHGLESASISSQSRMKAMHLPVYALTLTRQPQSALKLCSHPCAIAFIGRGSVAQAHTHAYTTNSCVGVSNAVPSCVLRTGQHRLHAGGGEYQPMTVYLYLSQPHSNWLTVPVKLVLPSRNKDCTHQSRIRTRRRSRGQSAWETCRRCSDGARWQICGKLT